MSPQPLALRSWFRIVPAALALFALLAGAFPAEARAKRPAAPSILDDAAFRTEVQGGLDHLYAMDFAAAQTAFSHIEARYPGHPVGPFLRALVPWWTLLLDPEDPRHDKEFLAAMDEVIRRSEARLRRNPDDMDGLFFRTGASAFRARLHAFRRDWFKAGKDGQSALRNLRKLQRRDPQNVDLLFGVGLFDYLVDVVPRQHKFLRPVAILFPKGDRKRGLEELHRAAREGQFVHTEAHYALFQVYMTFERDAGKALTEVSWLRKHHPENTLFKMAEGRVYARQNRWAEASLVFQEVAERQVAGEPGYSGALAQEALYWLARGEMESGRYEGALQYLDRLDYLAAEREYDPYYRAAGRLRRGMTYDVLGRRDEAVRCYREVLAIKGTGDVHDRAQEFLSRPYGRVS
ncbi:MAG TPA: tetratricopeptide repeat protein [Thermoanaerobaculia bacterium]|nr:tetratricopeptide repeat protein [Thermoanaerobaculia bacterium]